MKLVIYGAQGIALGAYNAIVELNPNINILCFIVTSIANNASTLSGIPVLELSEFIKDKSNDDKKKIEVLIGTPENFMENIEKKLDEVGLFNHIRLDSVRWSNMQKLAFTRNKMFTPLDVYPLGFHKPELQIFKMVHQDDNILQNYFCYPEYFIPLQVGAALANRNILPNRDDYGENISYKNRNYSELTGLYWIWKNILNDSLITRNNYVGLAHYRRFLDLTNDEMLKLIDNEIDVVLPYPMPYEPNIEAHHNRYLSQNEWSAVLQALNELYPEYAKVFIKILKQKYLYNFNIILAKGQVMNAYCEWLFPLLFRIEQLSDPNGTKIPNRFMGYIGETLETLYFMYNKNSFQIAHVGFRFLI